MMDAAQSPSSVVPAPASRVEASGVRASHRRSDPPVDRSAPQNPAAPPPAPDLDSTRRSPLVLALQEVVPGWQVVDQRLELDSGVLVDLVGVDRGGRVVLVLRVAGRGHSGLTAALDALAFAQRHGAVLRRAYAAERGEESQSVRVLAVSEHFDEDVRRRLSALAPCGLELVQLGLLRSAAGERLYALLQGPPAQERPADSPAIPFPEVRDSLEATLATADEDKRKQLRLIAGRLGRLDENLTMRTNHRGAAWFLDGEPLASIELRAEGQWVGSVSGRPGRELRGASGLDAFIDEVVAAYMDRAGGAERAPDEAGRPGLS
jgi:hypothetical protein